MLKKYSTIKWTVEAKKSFQDINLALTKTLVLISPKFDRSYFPLLLSTQLLQFYCREMTKAMNNLLLSLARS